MSPMSDLVANECSSLLQESLDKILTTYSHIKQLDVRSVSYIVVDPVMLDLLRK